MNTRHIFLLILPMLHIHAIAQNDSINTIDRSVDVINAYQPTLRSSKKINVDPLIDDTLKYSDNYQYQLLNRIAPVSTSPEPLTPASMDFPVYASPYRALVEAAIGSLPTFYGQIIYNNGNSNNHHLALHAGHLAQLGKVTLSNDDKVAAHQNDTWASIDYDHLAGNLRFNANANFANNAFNYYGLNTIIDSLTYTSDNDDNTISGADILALDKQRNTSFDLLLSLANSLVDPLQKFSFKAYAGFSLFGNKSALHQSDIHFGGNLRFPFKKVAAIDVDLAFNHFQTHAGDSSLILSYAEHKGSDINIYPHFRLDYDFMTLRLGARIISVLGDDFLGKDDFLVQPDLKINFFIGDGSVCLHAGLSGDFSQNSFRSLVQQCKYLSPDSRKYIFDGRQQRYVSRVDIAPSQAPIAFDFGLRGSFSHKVQAALGITYKSLTDEVFFVNRHFTSTSDTSNIALAPHFALLQDDGKLFNVHAELNVNPTPNSNILLIVNYDKYSLNSLSDAYNRPALTLSLAGKAKPSDRLALNAKLSYIGQRKALDPTTNTTTTLSAYPDLNIGANYYISNRWTAFLNLNNLTAADQQPLLGYSSFSFHALAGITYKF